MNYYDFQNNLNLKITEEFFFQQIRDKWLDEECKPIINSYHLSTEAHSQQKRLDDSPYIIHPLRVALLLLINENLVSSTIIIAAFLHDTLEDTKLTEKLIENTFGSEVLRITKSLTRYRSPYETPEERKDGKMNKWLDTMKSDFQVRIIKTYDYLDNMISWKFIKETTHLKKMSRWLMEAKTMYLPLAEITSKTAFGLMETELDYYIKQGYSIGDWYSDPIITNRLKLVGENINILVDEKFDSNSKGPNQISVSGQIYHRFMDFFYVPKILKELNRSEIIELCDIRTDYADQVIDQGLNSKVISCIIAHAYSTMPPNPIVLDFGCGHGLSTGMIKSGIKLAQVIGVDISPKAIEFSLSKGLDARLIMEGEPLPFPDNQFDIIIASFVMHFNIEHRELTDILRVLKKASKFYFNSYNDNKDAYFDLLYGIGFSDVNDITSNDIPDNHFILCCTK